MRVMELAVQRFGDELGVKLASEQNWQVILDKLTAAVRKMDAEENFKTKAYAQAASHLYNVKVAWRNEVMHPKRDLHVRRGEGHFRKRQDVHQRAWPIFCKVIFVAS